MDSINPSCTKLKQKYEACFNTWYSEKYLKGNITDECENLFKEYRACINSTLKSKKIDILLEEHNKMKDEQSQK